MSQTEEHSRLLGTVPRSYAKNEGDDEVAVVHMDGEQALPEGSSRNKPFSLLPAGSIRASVFNLVGNTLGAGCLALPYAFYRCGIAMSIFLLLLGMITSIYSLRLLVRCRHISGLKSFETLAETCYGHKTEMFVEINIILFCFGVCVAYVVAAGDILEPVMILIFGPDSIWAQRKVLLTVLVVLVILPLSSVSKVNTLRFTTALSVSSIVFLVLVIVAAGIATIVANPDFSHIKVGVSEASTNDIFFAAPIVIFAYCCQALVFVIYDELAIPSERTMFAVVDWAMVMVMCIYVAVGLSGYLAFQNFTSDDVLKNLNLDHPIIALAQGLFGVAVVLAYPLNIFPARHSIENMISRHAEFSLCRYMSITLAMVFGSLALALLIPSISSVFSLMGATTSVVVCFVAPALYFLKLFPSESQGERSTNKPNLEVSQGSASSLQRFTAWALLVGGVLVGIVSTVISIQQFYAHPSSPPIPLAPPLTPPS